MALTSAQLTALKADIAATPAIASKPNTADGNIEVADYYNQFASPDYFVWRSDVGVDEIFDKITWANFTPQDAPDATVIWSNRSLACQGKQFNLQTMLSGRSAFNAGKATLRGGLNDATTNLPSGSGGASRSGGWATILPILSRKSRRVEKLLAVATSGVGNNGADARGASTNPDLLTFEGTLTYTDIEQARNS